MGLYHNDSLTGKPLGHPVTADDHADGIAHFALTYLGPLIQLVIYYATGHDKSLTARLCGCDRRNIQRLIKSLDDPSPKDLLNLNLNSLLPDDSAKPLPTQSEIINQVIAQLNPFLGYKGGNPAQLGVTEDELAHTLKVLHNLKRLYPS